MPQASGSATTANAPIARKRDVVAPGSWLKRLARIGLALPLSTKFAQEPSWLYNANWDLMRLTARGLGVRDGSFSVQVVNQSVIIFIR